LAFRSSRPANAAAALPSPAEADRGDPPVIPSAEPSPPRTPPPPESDWCTRPRAWPARQGVRSDYLRHTASFGSPTRAVQANPPSCAPPETLTLASRRRRRRNLDSAANAPSRSTSRAAQGGEAPAGVVCCRFRAPRRLGAVAGVRRRTEPRCRVERRRRCDLAVRAALVGFPVVRATF
jgi:hypothetical protein